MRVSVVVNTKNEAQVLARCLQSAAWADEVVVLDMCSADDTVAIARRYTDKVYSCEDFGYVEPARNLATTYATGDWLFVLDADEVIPPRLAAHVRKIIAESDEYALVAIPRRNYIGDHPIKNSGRGLDYQPRLFRRGRVQWTDQPHTWPQVDGAVRYLPPDSGLYIKHYAYENLSDLVARLNRHTSVAADACAPDAEWLNWQGMLRETLAEFARHYTPKEDGFYSLALAGNMAFARFITHCKRLEQVRQTEGDVVFPLPDSAAELFAEALRQLPLDLSSTQAGLQPQATVEELQRQEEELRQREDELAQVRATYEARLDRLTTELADARAAHTAEMRRLTDELAHARAVHEAQVAALTEELTQARTQAAVDKTKLAQQTNALAQQANELAEVNARLAEREAQSEQQTSLLLKLRAQVDKKDEVLEWIYTSRSWQAASSLRRLRDLKNQWWQYGVKFGRNTRLPVRPLFYGHIEAPTEAANVAGELAIEGWVFSTDAAIVRVEAFLDDIYLGRLHYGIKREDVTNAYPAQARAECGYSEIVTLKANMAGQRKLIVRAYDALGHMQIYTRLLVVGAPKLLLRPVAPTGNGHRALRHVAAGARTNGGEPSYYQQLQTLVDEFKSRTESEPAILDWNTGLSLAAALPQLAVFSPPAANGRPGLPYLDHSVDIVVLPGGDPRHLAEAHRVAAAAVVQAHGATNGHVPLPGGQKLGTARVRLVTEWKEAMTGETVPPTASIIIPVHNKVEYTEQCLKQVLDTLPHNFRGEIIVVDDASTDETPAALNRWTQRDARIRVLRNEQNKGFIDSCNAGATAAQGEVLVFLNNDTLPLPGWLPPLLRVLRERPDAGAVGGKLIYPDGTLQEAGGIVFSDGSGCNFGRNDKSPNAPLYSFLREVDYCSGALLATPRALFHSLGGFDTRFAPAYYEDTDYCFSLREAGRKVYYQPESVIIHFEGVSSGTDVKKGIKSFQVLNRTKFVAKWQHVLRRQPAAPRQYDFNTLHALVVREEKRDAGAD